MPISEREPTTHVMGVDLGGSNVRVVLCGLDGTPVADAAEPTSLSSSRAIVQQIAALCAETADRAGIDRAGVGAGAVGVPGVTARAGGALRLAPNLPPFGDLDLARALGDELGFPVEVDNDVNMATVAEHRRGLGANASDFVFIAVGTGVGMGIVAGGRLVRGATGAAGEIGLLPLGANPFDPANHVQGALEVAAGGLGLAHRYATQAGLPPGGVTTVDVYDRAADGDRRALGALEEQAATMAMAVVAVHSILDPQLVVFGGGIGSRRDFAARVREHLPRLTNRKLPVEISALGERAGVLGAADVALASVARELEEPVR